MDKLALETIILQMCHRLQVDLITLFVFYQMEVFSDTTNMDKLAIIDETEQTNLLKDNWTPVEIMKVAADALLATATPQLVRTSFEKTGIHPHNPQHVIEKMFEKKRKRVDATDDSLLLKPTFVNQVVSKKNTSGRLSICGLCITGDEAYEKILEHSQRKKGRPQSSAAAAESRDRKTPICWTCGLPRKGHSRGSCPTASSQSGDTCKPSSSSAQEDEPSSAEDDSEDEPSFTEGSSDEDSSSTENDDSEVED